MAPEESSVSGYFQTGRWRRLNQVPNSSSVTLLSRSTRTMFCNSAMKLDLSPEKFSQCRYTLCYLSQIFPCKLDKIGWLK